MISERILNIFKQREDAISGYKSYVVFINDIQNNLNDACDQESVLIETTELRVPTDKVNQLLQAYSSKKRILELVSSIDVNKDGLYYGKLNAFIDSDDSEEEEVPPEVLSRDVSILKTTLQKEIYIEFLNPFVEQPIIHITIDKKYKSLYRDYSTEFIKDSNDKNFVGVNITFKSLKLKQSYPMIGVIIIGDNRENFYEEEDGEYKVITFLVHEEDSENDIEETDNTEETNNTEEDACVSEINDIINKMIYNADIYFIEQEENLKTNRCGKVINLIENDAENTYHLRVEKEGYETKYVEYNTEEDVINIELTKNNPTPDNEEPELEPEPEPEPEPEEEENNDSNQG